MKDCSVIDGKVLNGEKWHPFKTWEKGDLTYTQDEADLQVTPPGGKIGNLFSGCTRCPLECMNATCQDAVEMKIKVADTCPKIISIETCGVNPVMEPGTVFTRKIYICTLGIEDVEDCPLNK